MPDTPVAGPVVGAVRHSILDLAPLELDCMNALWPLGEATVRDIQQALYPTRPRAYTTIMTILDRLAQKGVLLRRKAGRAWVYRANLTADEARSHALEQLVNGFFAGSTDGLIKHLTGGIALSQPEEPGSPARPVAPRVVRNAGQRKLEKLPPPVPEPEKNAAEDLDASLL